MSPDRVPRDTASLVALTRELAAARLGFIGLGTVKAGTTWLMQCLEEHPDVEGPTAARNKEIHYFTGPYERGHVWYHAQFAWRSPMVGEFGTQYLASRDALHRIRDYRADIRLLASLRDPLRRAWSHYQHHLREGLLASPAISFREACEANPSFVDLGRYGEQLERLHALFHPDQCHVVLYDDIRADPAAVVAAAYRFLDVDASVTPPSLHETVNPSRAFRSRRLQNLARVAGEQAERRLGPRARALLEKTRARQLLRRVNERPAERLAVTPPGDDDAAWFRARLGDDVAALADRLGRDLSGWLQPLDRR